MQDVILKIDKVKDEFEYIYLFGTNGVEKRYRLNLISKLKQDHYNLEFFQNDTLEFGHLLIYGMSFGNNKIMPIEYLKENPEQENFYLLRSVDGHILTRINELFQQGRLQKITMSYHTQGDLENLTNIVAMTEFASIVDFQQSNQVFQFEKVVVS